MLATFARLATHSYRSRPTILGYRDARLRETLVHAYDESPFHRERFEAAGLNRRDLTSVPITELPTLSPQTLEAEFNRIVTDPAVSLSDVRDFLQSTDDRHTRFHGEYVALRSSGTEGEPTPFLYSEAEWDRVLASEMRSVVAALDLGVLADLAGENRVAYVAGTEGNFQGIVGAEETASRAGDTLRPFSPSTPFPELADELTAFDPTQLVGYPSTLTAVADLVADGRCRIDVTYVLSAGEPLPADTRAYLEETFDAPLLNLYATTETGALGIEPPDSPGMYLFDDTVYLEYHDDKTLVTPLFHRTIPLVRFELPDVLHPLPRPSNPRLPFSLVASVVGRSEDILRFPDGLLFSTVLNDISAAGATQFQFAKRDARTLEVRYQRRPDVDSDAVQQRVADAVGTVLRNRGLDSVSVVPTESDLTYDPHTGKTPLVVHTDHDFSKPT